jgi:hypothetical protein
MATLNPEFPQPLMDALEGPEDTEGLVVDFTEEMDSDVEESVVSVEATWPSHSASQTSRSN